MGEAEERNFRPIQPGEAASALLCQPARPLPTNIRAFSKVLMRNRSGNFSMGRLIDFLTALGQDVQITGRTKRKEHGALSVAVPG